MNYCELYNRNYNKNVKNFIAIVHNIKCQSLSCEKFNIFSVRQIIDELILECSSNKLKVKRNITFFNELIKNVKEKLYLINKKQKGDINLLLGKLNEKNPNSDLVLTICMQLKKEFCLKEYFNFLVDNLKFYLQDDAENYYEIIKELVEHIFIELMYNGYSLDEVAKIILSLFSLAENTEKSQFPVTEFPINLIKNNYPNDELSKYINNMSVDERIEYIKKMYTNEKNIYYVIISVSGIVIDENNLKCNNDILFYNPNISDPLNLTFKDNFRDDKFNNIDYTKNCNACITVLAHNVNDAYNQGIKKLGNYINILKIISMLDNYKICENNCVILDKSKTFIHASYSSYKNEYDKRKFEREIRAINEKDFFYDKKVKELSKKMENLIYASEDIQNKTDIALLNSIKKYSDAIDSSNDQEAFLKYWSALESLFDENLGLDESNKKIDNVLEVISAYLVYIVKYEPLHNLYNELKIATIKPFIPSTSEIIKLPKTILDKLGLLKNSKVKNISLDLLLNYNDKISKKINDYYYNSKIVNTKLLYTDTQVAFSTLSKNKEKYKNNIIMIYRIRNQIIHDAYCNDIPIKFYLPLLKKVVNCFLNTVIDEYIENKNKTISEIIYTIYTKSILLINNSKENTLQSLLY